MAAHRYWRVFLRVNPANVHLGLKEMVFRTVAGGANACTGGTVIVSGTESGSPALLVDGSTVSGEWTSNRVTNFAWAGYDFGSPVTIVEVELTTSGNEYARTTGGVIQASDDGATWVTMSPGILMGTNPTPSAYTFQNVAELGNSIHIGGVITLSPGWPAQALNAQVRGEVSRFDIEDGGTYRIAGVTRKESAPDVFVVYPYRRVRLLERQTGRLLREMWSDPVTGAYAFEKLKLREYILLTDDHARFYNAVAADAIVPVL